LEEGVLLSIARELAMDLRPVETILKDHGKTPKDLENYFKLPRFRGLVEEFRLAWAGVTNTEERVRLKSLAMVEETLPEMFRRLHSSGPSGDPLSSKVELLKTVAKFAGIGQAEGKEGGAKVSITINLGNDQPINVQASLPTQVIEGEIVDVEA
jgi:hypothetical protein